MIWLTIASFIEKVAELGAGFLSYGASYEPEIPQELQDIEKE